MQNIFVDEGNLGFDPSIKTVPVNTPAGVEQRNVVELQVRFDVRKKKGDAHTDVGGFWARVQMWGKRAEYLHKHLKKGCRVLVVGEISQHEFIVQKGERKGQEATALEIDASHIALVLLGVESITFQEKTARSDETTTHDENEAESSDIPFDR